MIHTEKKFAYRHKPTGKWVELESFYDEDVRMCLVDDFVPEYNAYYERNVIEEDLLRSVMHGERYAAKNFLEFELVEIEIEYRLKT